MSRPCPLVPALLAVLLLAGTLFAGDSLRITIPKRSHATPVQKLNQEGVAAVKKHQYDKAKKLFYRAYLLDPDDPFTLNNLGYMAELDGELDRAQRFYDLSAQQRSDATVFKATSKTVEGKAVSDVAGKAEDAAMNINRYNVQALSLLQKDRAPEADILLQKALALDGKNPFTLNNLGFAREKEGEYEQALNFYTRSANLNSEEPIVVAANPDWRGKAISDIASENAQKLRKLMRKVETPEMRIARLNLQGVSAMNRNDHATARDDFQRAYKLDPNNAFTLNNMGYLAELDGDRETADFYYAKAGEAKGANQKVMLATRKEAEGQRIGQVAVIGDTKVNQTIEADRVAREREGGPIQLRRRDNSAVVEPDKAPEPLPDEEPAPPQKDQAPQNPDQLLQPLPDNQQSGSTAQQPQPDNAQQPAIATPAQQPQQQQQQPQSVQPGQPAQPGQGEPAVQPAQVQQPQPQQQPAQPAAPPVQTPQAQPPQPQQGQTDNGLIMPLPDDKQPGTAQPPATPAAPQKPQQQPAPQPTVPHDQPQVRQGANDNGLLMPIPDQPAQSGVQPSGMPAAPAQAQPQGQNDNGLIMPLPDNQQPTTATRPQTTTPPATSTPPAKTPPKKTDKKPVKKVIINN